MEAIKENPRRIFLIGLVLLVLICLVAVLIFNVFFGQEIAGGNTPTPALTPTEALTSAPSSGTEEPTVTPTRVVQGQATTEPTETPTTPVATPTPAPTATPTRSATVAASVGVVTAPQPGAIANLLKNGDFEQGFDQRGVALAWEPFKNDGVQAIYGQETFPYVESGSSAQRITVSGASDYNRYAGLYQQVEVVPNEVYTLTLHGQIRTGFGDVNQSSYGYRMQYAVANLKNWQNVPEADWVELPWDEQLLNASATQFYSYTTTIQPPSETITLFVRTWNKWPDPGEVQYTFDSFSLVGPTSVSQPLIASTSPTTTTTPGEPIINKPLPITGADDGPALMHDGRFWIGVLILLLLALGSVYRAKWGYR